MCYAYRYCQTTVELCVEIGHNPLLSLGVKTSPVRGVSSWCHPHIFHRHTVITTTAWSISFHKSISSGSGLYWKERVNSNSKRKVNNIGMLTDEERVESLHPPDLQAVNDFIKEALQTKDKVYFFTTFDASN